MQRPTRDLAGLGSTTVPYITELYATKHPVRAVGAHNALGAALIEIAGLDAVWASSFEISAARCLPDASLLTMTDYLEATAQMRRACGLPIVADVDTGFGGAMNVVHMVREYEREGIGAVCMEDKVFPKMNSFVAAEHCLLPVEEFCHKIEVAKAAQASPDFHIIARTEALISGLGVDAALERCHAYADAGADSVLVHSKQKSNAQVLEFLAAWQSRRPAVVVPTTYPDWQAADAYAAGVSMVIYANQGLRAAIQSMSSTLRTIQREGSTCSVEDRIATIGEVFELQRLRQWIEASE
ncbi:MAG TPA: isocitrate lyase/phosphoenolpyruvate mutase family protein [Jatrophihabitans sp.]|jgi:phosphoenolpyruvate phosphomutase|uniref:isocitrate lyase/phosphoenolpyruvate mutase family protein n=1 Tax=Jatrophihabitans sp. TaxID=1932789 RepID=UPI002EE98140